MNYNEHLRQGLQLTLRGTGDYHVDYTGQEEPKEIQRPDSGTQDRSPRFLGF